MFVVIFIHTKSKTAFVTLFSLVGYVILHCAHIATGMFKSPQCHCNGFHFYCLQPKQYIANPVNVVKLLSHFNSSLG